MTDYECLVEALYPRREFWRGENKTIAAMLEKAGAIVLPCEIGSTVYYINGNKNLYITEHTVKGFYIGKKSREIVLNDFRSPLPNERLFFSQKAAIKELNRRLINYEN